jgi:hypothetical protein
MHQEIQGAFSKSAFAARPINLKNRGWTNTKMRTAARVALEGKVKISRQGAKTRSGLGKLATYFGISTPTATAAGQ